LLQVEEPDFEVKPKVVPSFLPGILKKKKKKTPFNDQPPFGRIMYMTSPPNRFQPENHGLKTSLKLTCPLKVGHLKRKLHLPTINFRVLCWLQGG